MAMDSRDRITCDKCMYDERLQVSERNHAAYLDRIDRDTNDHTRLECGQCGGRVPASRLVTVQATNQYCCQECLDFALVVLKRHYKLSPERRPERSSLIRDTMALEPPLGPPCPGIPTAALVSIRRRDVWLARLFRSAADGTERFLRTLHKWVTTDPPSSGS